MLLSKKFLNSIVTIERILKMNVLGLPSEIWVKILSFTSLGTLADFRQTSKGCKALAEMVLVRTEKPVMQWSLQLAVQGNILHGQDFQRRPIAYNILSRQRAAAVEEIPFTKPEKPAVKIPGKVINAWDAFEGRLILGMASGEIYIISLHSRWVIQPQINCAITALKATSEGIYFSVNRKGVYAYNLRTSREVL